MTDPSDRRPRRRLAIGLRALMAVVVLVALPISWKTNRARVQRQAVEAIQRANGSVAYDYNYSGWRSTRPPKSPTEPPGPRWLRKRLGDEYFQEVVAVEFVGDDQHSARPTRADLSLLAAFDRLKGLTFLVAPIRDADLACLEGLGRLEELNFFGMHEVGDAGLAHLAGLRSLTSLSLKFTQVTDSGLVHLAKLDGLERLDLSMNIYRINGSGLAQISGLNRLKWLNLHDSWVHDAGMAHLRGLDALEELNVIHSGPSDAGAAERLGVGDVGLSYLAQLPRLRTLSVDTPNLTDTGLAHLGRGFPALTSLYIGWSSKVSPEGLARLQAARPKLAVRYRGLTLTGPQTTGGQ